MPTLKAGCFLVNKEKRAVAIIFREGYEDYSFPKGHVEEGETTEETALRETAEEVKREGEILKDYPPYIERYTSSRGEECVCYMYIALDRGKSDNASEDTHTLIWVPVEEVEKKLSYESLKTMWRVMKKKVLEVLNGNVIK